MSELNQTLAAEFELIKFFAGIQLFKRSASDKNGKRFLFSEPSKLNDKKMNDVLLKDCEKLYADHWKAGARRFAREEDFVTAELNFLAGLPAIVKNDYETVISRYESILKIKLKPGKKAGGKKADKPPFQRQVAIACNFLGDRISNDNYQRLMKKFGAGYSRKALEHSEYSYKKQILRYKKDSSKSSNTRLFNDLKAARDLITGVKKDPKKAKALTDINEIITAFESDRKSHLG
jgi:hypothetical protein